jgi:hypothetical protein
MRRKLTHMALAIFLITFGQGAHADADSLSAASCTALAMRDFAPEVGSNVTIDKTEIAADGGNSLTSHCHILATIAPSTGVEIQLPVSAWNGRLLFTGCGGACGVIRTVQGADALARRYAVATTDMGHRFAEGQDPRWWINDQDIVEEFKHRATHRATLLSKAIIAAAYGRPQDYAYFRGCSTGGRQGLTEAVMYPGDYDGVIAGASGTKIVIPHNLFAYAANTRPDGSGILTVEAINLLAEEAMNTCDMDDGLKDKVIGDPSACAFDPATLLCDGPQTERCLTNEQIGAANKVYQGARRDDGTPFYAMGYAKGTELDWTDRFIGPEGKPPRGERVAQFALERLVGPGATLADFDYGKHSVLGSPLSGAIDLGPDGKKLAAFINGGRKIIMYHGWADPEATPASSLYFYQAQADAFGEDTLGDFLRLFMFPGMKHCRGGNGVNTADYLAAIERWVEHDEAPASLDAYRTTAEPFNYIAHPLDPDTVVTGRKLFPYPSVSIYAGSGDLADPQKWTKK